MATLGQQAIGTVVKIKENNVPQEWIVMHHGDMPAFGTSLEASSGAAGGTWLLRKNIVSQGAICEYTTSVGGKKTYENSPADTYLTNTFLPTISSEIRNQILTVSIEISYLVNGRTRDTTISRKAFLPDLNELENTWGNAPYDGSASYIATYNGAAADYWLRNSPRVSDPNITWSYVRAEGKTNSHKVIYRNTIAGYRPFIVVNSSIFVSTDGTVTVNTPPVISGSNGGLGTFGDTPPSYRYTVTDAQGGAVSVQEKLDNVVKRTYNVSLGSQNNFTISASDWRSVLNGNHTMAVTATDSQGASSTRSMTLIKNVTSLGFTLSSPMVADAMPDRCVINIQGNFPGGSTLKVEICNNGYDSSPTWEDITIQAQNGQKYFFTNKAKTASQWGVNLRVSLNRGSSSEPCYVSSIGGNFE